jgi:hypothetical protein
MCSFKSPYPAMVEHSPIPIQCTIPVAYFAIWRVAGLYVVGVGGIIILSLVAGKTFRGRSYILIVLMTRGTLCCFMHPVKGKNKMRVHSPLPINRIMTYFTILRELCKNMIGIIHLIIVFPVAIDTISYLAGKSTSRMTSETVDRFMNPFEEKSRIMFMAP